MNSVMCSIVQHYHTKQNKFNCEPHTETMKLISSVIVKSAPERQRAMAPQEHVEEPDDSLALFEIGDMDSDDDELQLVDEEERESIANLIAENIQAKPTSKMQDPCYEINNDFEPTAYQPKYQAIQATGEDDDVTAPRRNMLGFAAYHGPRFIPAEIKDNLEHWRSNTVTAAPRLGVAPPANLWGNY